MALIINEMKCHYDLGQNISINDYFKKRCHRSGRICSLTVQSDIRNRRLNTNSYKLTDLKHYLVVLISDQTMFKFW